MNRTVFSLDGIWSFVVDLDPKYHGDPHEGFGNEYAMPASSRRHWQAVSVPGVWQKYGERYDLFEGVGWFAREFEAPEPGENTRARLRFGGVNYLCRVFLNGIEIGGHEGGYTEFTLDCAGALRGGKNLLVVQVDNRATTIKWPPVLGYFNYGGIHRGVSLEMSRGPSLADVKVHAGLAGGWGELIVRGRVEDFQPGCLLRVSCAGAVWEEEIRGAESAAVDLHLPGVDLWSPENPALYAVTVELLDPGRGVADRREYQCGFRTLAVEAGRVRLNGEALALRGICYVYDSPAHGLVMTAEQIEADLRQMKEVGCNAVRCHTPMDPLFYTACDRMGLLVWIEPPVYCYHPGDTETGTRFADPLWLGLAEQMAREMVAVARSHPCVAIYSIGNECNTANPEAEAFFRRLAGVLRAEDPTRLISYAALYGAVGALADIVDILGINSYWGWYDKIWNGQTPEPWDGQSPLEAEPIDLSAMRAMLDAVLARQQSLALLLTEFGADSAPGFFSRGRELWSEEYHAELLRRIFALAGEYPQIAGTFPFCFSDYRDPSKIPNGYWNEMNLKGMVSYNRRPKLAASAVREAYLK